MHTTGGFGATGNSGGSAELGYALSTWGAGDFLDVAVPTGGPPMSRLDWLCLNPTTWRTRCRTIMPANVMECGRPSCTIRATGPVCTSCNANPTPRDLHADSILHPAAVVAYPRTRVHVILGARDCSSATPNGMVFFDAVQSEKAISFPTGTPHWVPSTAAGRDAIARALLGGLACRPGSIGVRAWPRVGGRLDLDVHGPVGRPFLVFVATRAATVELAPFGWVFLAAPIPLGGGSLDPRTGRATLSVPIPPNGALAGLPLHDQALLGSCLSNLVRFRILP